MFGKRYAADIMKLFVEVLGYLASVVVLCGSEAWSATPLQQAERLRRLARLPKPEFTPLLSFNPFNGFNLLYDRVSVRREAEALGKALSESPGDAIGYVRLGILCREIDNTGKANVAFSTAARIFERQGIENSSDSKALAAYGEALAGLGRDAEAEHFMRRSVRMAGHEWESHAVLGRFLTARACRLALSDARPLIGPGADMAWFRKGRELVQFPDRLKRAQESAAEARTAIERAIELAPCESELRVWCAAAKCVQRYLTYVLDMKDAQEYSQGNRVSALFSPELAHDVAVASRLSSTNARVAAMSAVYVLLASSGNLIAEHLGKSFVQELWACAPEEVRLQVQDTMGRLEAIGQSDDPRIAASALESLGNIQFFLLGDSAAGETNLRRAVVLDSERGRDALAILLLSTGQWNELLEFCETSLKKIDTLEARLVAAIAFEKLGKLDEMVLLMSDTHRRYPDDFYSNLAMALTLIRISGGQPVISQATTLWLRAEKAAGKRPTRHQQAELLFAKGLLLSVRGEIESARACFEQVLALEPDNPEARQALEILELAG